MVKMLVIADKYGQLGNRLFTYSHTIACAAQGKYTVLNPCFFEYSSFFEGSLGFPCAFPPSNNFQFRRAVDFILRNKAGVKLHDSLVKLMFYVISFSSRYSSILVNIDFDKHEFKGTELSEVIKRQPSNFIFAFLAGWKIRDKENIVKYADIIRDYFKPVAPFFENVKTLIYEVRKASDIIVGVHIRHGDYETFNNGIYYYSMTEYINLMKQMKALFPSQRVKFLVSSNEDLSTEDFGCLDVRVANGHLIEDMYALAKCDYILGPPSTYSMWASFYGEVPLYSVKNPLEALSLDKFEICIPD